MAVNPGTLASHTKWAEEFGFQFPIVVDKDKKVAAAYGAVNMLGNIKRTVVVVDKQGKVAWIKEGMPETADILSVIKG